MVFNSMERCFPLVGWSDSKKGRTTSSNKLCSANEIDNTSPSTANPDYSDEMSESEVKNSKHSITYIYHPQTMLCLLSELNFECTTEEANDWQYHFDSNSKSDKTLHHGGSGDMLAVDSLQNKETPFQFSRIVNENNNARCDPLASPEQIEDRLNVSFLIDHFDIIHKPSGEPTMFDVREECEDDDESTDDEASQDITEKIMSHRDLQPGLINLNLRNTNNDLESDLFNLDDNTLNPSMIEPESRSIDHFDLDFSIVNNDGETNLINLDDNVLNPSTMHQDNPSNELSKDEMMAPAAPIMTLESLEFEQNHAVAMKYQDKSFIEHVNTMALPYNLIKREKEERERLNESDLDIKFQSVIDDMKDKVKAYSIRCAEETVVITAKAESKMSNLEETLNSVQEELELTKKMLEAECQTYESRLCELKMHYETLLNAQEISFAERLQTLESDHNAKTLSLRDQYSYEITKLQSEVELTKFHEVENAVMEAVRAVSLDMEAKFQTEIGALTVKHSIEMTELATRDRVKMEELQTELAKNLNEVHDKLRETKEKHDAECHNYDSRLHELKTHYEELIKHQNKLFVDKFQTLETGSKTKILALQQRHSDNINKIRHELEESRVRDIESASQKTAQDVTLKMETILQSVVNEMKENHANELMNFKIAYETASAESNVELSMLAENLRTVESALQEARQGHETECRASDTRMSELKRDYETQIQDQEKLFVDKFQALEEDYAVKLCTQREYHANEITRIQQELAESEACEIEKATHDTATAISAQMKTEFESIVSGLREKQNQEMKSYKMKFEIELAGINEECQCKVSELQEKHKIAQADLLLEKQKYESQCHMLESRLHELNVHNEKFVKNQEKSFVEKLKEVETESNAKILQLQKHHSNEIARVQNELEQLKHLEVAKAVDDAKTVSLQMETEWQTVVDELKENHANEMNDYRIARDQELLKINAESHSKVTELEQMLTIFQNEIQNAKRIHENEIQIYSARLHDQEKRHEAIIKNREETFVEKLKALDAESKAKILAQQERHTNEIARIQREKKELFASDLEKATKDTAYDVVFQKETAFQAVINDLKEKHADELKSYKLTCDNELARASVEWQSKLSDLNQKAESAEASKEKVRLEAMEEIRQISLLHQHEMQVLIERNDSAIEGFNDIVARCAAEAEKYNNIISYHEQEVQASHLKIDRLTSLLNDAVTTVELMEENQISKIKILQSDHERIGTEIDEKNIAAQDENSKYIEKLETELAEARRELEYQAQANDEKCTKLAKDFERQIDLITRSFEQQFESEFARQLVSATLLAHAEPSTDSDVFQPKESKLNVDNKCAEEQDRKVREETEQSASELEPAGVESREISLKLTNAYNLIASLQGQLRCSEAQIIENTNELGRVKMMLETERNELRTQNSALREEILDHTKKNVQMDYLKSIVVKSLSLQTGSDEWRRLIPVLASILHFDATDKKLIEGVVNKNSWFVPTLINFSTEK